MRDKKLAAFAVVSFFLMIPLSSAETMYKWIGKDGVVHLTNNPTATPSEFWGQKQETVTYVDYRQPVEEIEVKNEYREKLLKIIEPEKGVNLDRGANLDIGKAFGITLISGLTSILFLGYRKFWGQKKRGKERNGGFLIVYLSDANVLIYPQIYDEFAVYTSKRRLKPRNQPAYWKRKSVESITPRSVSLPH